MTRSAYPSRELFSKKAKLNLETSRSFKGFNPPLKEEKYMVMVLNDEEAGNSTWL